METKKTAALKPRVTGVYFNDGCIRRSDWIYLSGKLKNVDSDEYEFSRCFGYNARDPREGGGPRWGHDDYPGLDVVSTCYLSAGPHSADAGWNGSRFVVLSKRGDVVLGAAGMADETERIVDSDRLGALSQIKQIGDRLYVCGTQGQVYRRDPGGWIHIDHGIFEPKTSPDALHLNGIDGTSGRDIYVCGFGGRVLHFDGARWDEHVSPTNVHLERVHCVSASEVYFCGNKGTFLRLVNGAFTDFSIRTDEHFWGMTSFQGKIYLATLKGLYVFDGSKVRPVRTGLEPPIGGYRLDARDDQLWSFGVDDLAWFDGKTWTRLKHPDNP